MEKNPAPCYPPFTNMEDIIRYVDKTGRWQYWTTARTGFVLIGMSLVIYVQALFFVGKMDHNCISYEELDTFDGMFNRTLISDVTRQQEQLEQSSACSLSTEVNGKGKSARCVRWQYSSSYYDSTMISDYDLVCDRAYLVPTFQSSVFVGQILGNLFTGILSDRYGRHVTLLLGYFGVLVVSLALGFVNSVWWSLVLRGICGLCVISAWNAIFVCCMELAVPERRYTVVVFSALSWPLGAGLASLMAVFIRHWRQLCWITVVAAAVTGLPVALTLPESPRWLVIHQKFDRGHKLLSNIAKKNSVAFPADDEYLKAMYRRHAAQQPKKRISHLQQVGKLLGERRLRLRSAMLAISWIIVAFVYFGVLIYGNDVLPGASPMLLQGAMALTRVVAYPFYVVTYNFFGCRNTLRNALIAICIMLLGLGMLPIPRDHPLGAFAYGGVFVLAHVLSDLCFSALYMVTGELYPTVLRQTSLGVFSLIGRTGSFVATYAATLLTQIWLPLPAVVFSCASAIAALAVLVLPRDADDAALPDSVRDAHNLDESITQEKLMAQRRRSSAKSDSKREEERLAA